MLKKFLLSLSLILSIFAAPAAFAQVPDYQTFCGPVDFNDRNTMRDIAMARADMDSRLRQERYLVDKAYIYTIEHPSLKRVPRAPDGTRPPKVGPDGRPIKKETLNPFERLRNFFVRSRSGSPVTTDFMIAGARANVAQIYQANAASGPQDVLDKIKADILQRHPTMDPGVAAAVSKYVLVEHLQSEIDAIYASIVADLDRWRCLQDYSEDINEGFETYDYATNLNNIETTHNHFATQQFGVTFEDDDIDLNPFLAFMREARDMAVAVLGDVEDIEDYTRTIEMRFDQVERGLSTTVPSETWTAMNAQSYIDTAVNVVHPMETGIQLMNDGIAGVEGFLPDGPDGDDDIERIEWYITIIFGQGAGQVFGQLEHLDSQWLANDRYLNAFPNPNSQFRGPLNAESLANLTRARQSMTDLLAVYQVVQSIP